MHEQKTKLQKTICVNLSLHELNVLKWPPIQQTYDLRLCLILRPLFLHLEDKPSNDLLGNDQSMDFLGYNHISNGPWAIL